MALSGYLRSEVCEDLADGLIGRREALRRLVLLGLSLPAATALVAACGDDDDGGDAGSVAPAPTEGARTTVAAAPITFPGPDGDLQGWYAEAAEPAGAVLLIHENRGLTDHFQSLPGRFAESGYSALSIDLLSREGGTSTFTDPAQATAALGAAAQERLTADMQAGLDELARRAPGAKLAAVGFCFGGAQVWNLVASGDPRLAAAVPFYGPGPADADFSASSAAVLGVYAELDERVNASQDEMRGALDAAGLTYELRTFPGVDHAFFNDTGARYDEGQAAAAYQAVLDWFATHFGLNPAAHRESARIPRMEQTLPYRVYLDAAVYEAERERLFSTQWFQVARQEDLAAAGDWRRVDVAGEQVLLVRGEDGALRGFANTCRHRGAELCPADGPESGHAGRFLRCPYHHWTYGLDGRLRAAPHLDEAPEGVALYPAGVGTWGGFVFVCLRPDGAAALAEQVGGADGRTRNYPLAELRRGARLTYEVAANWKVIAENYNECYHCGPVHPELCDLVPSFRRGGGGGLTWEEGIPHRDGAWTFTATGTTRRSPFASLSEAERTRHKGELIYPNLLLSLSADHVVAFTLQPRDAGHTTVICDFLFARDEIASADFDPADAVDFWDVVNRQDWRIGESVQRGMASWVAERGWFAPMEDESADIRRWYRTLMGDDIDA